MSDTGIPSIGPGVLSEMIEAWGEALERKDPGTWGHCQRVAVIATTLARALRLDDAEIKVIADGALLHEIGKLAIPETILQKPARLTREEMLVMREYCSQGYEMLRKVPSLAGVAEITYTHRERFDGTGFPRGLKGEAIPLGARIVRVADAVDSIIRDRPHDRACALAATRTEIAHWSGRDFDPQVVEVFLSVRDDATIEGWFSAI
jgi:HD-GYP domain-containing protein (c-di-GMP phosphodiesterase class II)